ncbi:phosphodiesterase [Paracoccus saliphilus]|uniref:Phosphodiesterase n=1 Tax=Paracoccus saliphilus TaxID=405559 RepID=A0AA45W8P3_9RHOB|nr:phosphodiesterase [Paracoccus saliphilus]WCR04839.1 phosphodiesterase [Paracoccus saliphilus]SIT17919.1 3',5'-cyclic AMP phosphodiesterase CpdA [Paracoccus saliphilus]
MRKLVWLTDLHLVEQGRDWPHGIDPLARLRYCLDEIRALHSDAERLVISGDLIQIGNPGAYGILRSELDRMPMPYHLLTGNHDNRAALLASFPELSSAEGFIQGVEDLGDMRLLYLDTLAADGKHHGELCPIRMRWVREQIRSADERPLLIFLHHPPCDIGVPALDRLRLFNSEELGDLIRARNGATHLFCGHVHRNASGLWAGHPFATLKSLHVQFDLDVTGSGLTRSIEPPGYGIIFIGPNEIILNYRDIPAL